VVSRFILAVVVAGVALVNVGCEAETVPMPTGNAELRRELLVELDNREIWYNVVDDSHIEIEYEDTGLVGELFNSMIRNVLPRGRSFAPAPHALRELAEALQNQDIACNSVHVFDKDWVVCDSEEDMKVVDEILFRIVTEDDGVRSN
jgi:hypothetical protein